MDNFTVRVPKEIREYRERYYGLTARQIIAVILIGIIVAPIYMLLNGFIGQQIAAIVAMLVASPIVAFGWITYQGMDAEKILGYILRDYMTLYKPLAYETDEENEARKYYYSHITGPLVRRAGFSKKARAMIDSYFEETKVELLKQLREGKAPKKIRPRRLTSEEMKALRRAEERRQETIKRKRQENLRIKEIADRRKAVVSNSIQGAAMKQEAPRQERTADTNIVEDMFADLFVD